MRVRATPLYTQLEEVDVTNAFDRWNVIFGPWLFANAYNDPWYVRSPIFGFKAGVYKTQEVDAGPFVGYRTNDMTIVAGAEIFWDHLPLAEHADRLDLRKGPGHHRPAPRSDRPRRRSISAT